ncbi:hypothetical protein TSUD_310590 [Trifolium subterraneum]|uniref:Uncharacterized protein n=1 Tax=Trifolium subterraneum TaxID=3900 RepID=A0A2Z6MQK3_TRISU|nr:hypothetical protein TSUD_310590 [Trifolium subterraneum]
MKSIIHYIDTQKQERRKKETNLGSGESFFGFAENEFVGLGSRVGRYGHCYRTRTSSTSRRRREAVEEGEPCSCDTRSSRHFSLSDDR